ncbi:hypothetical protein BPJM79_30406 [Bacillus pumilus]
MNLVFILIHGDVLFQVVNKVWNGKKFRHGNHSYFVYTVRQSSCKMMRGRGDNEP